MKNVYLIAFVFAVALGLFLYVRFKIIFFLFIPPLFVYLFRNRN